MRITADRQLRIAPVLSGAFVLLLLTMPVPEALAGMSEYKSTCKDIGFKPGTEKFGECVLKLHARGKKSGARNRDAEERRLAAQRESEARAQQYRAQEQARLAAQQRALQAQQQQLINMEKERLAQEENQRKIKAWQGFLTGVGKVIDNRAGYVPPSQRQPMRRTTTTNCSVSNYYGTVNCTTR
tara:strand:+ start:1680 stop:2231 length:552 start_codon:yes stop_codon:yes gene_type:complete